MNLHEGDSVIHRTHGLGKVVRLEERTLSGESIQYYAIQIGDMTIWVPADDLLETRLRLPTRASEFKGLIGILSQPGEPLPADRRERKSWLLERLRDGRTESYFRVIRSLATYQQEHALNMDEQSLMNRSQHALVGEWGFAMSIPVAQAQFELHRLLAPNMQEAAHPEVSPA